MIKRNMTRRAKKGQFLIAAAIMIMILLLAVSAIAYQVLVNRQDIQEKPIQDLTEAITASFREALTVALANLTQTYNKTGNMNLARMNALKYLSLWKLTVMNAYVSTGLQVDFDFPAGNNSAYILQGEKQIFYNGIPENVSAWEIYNLSQLYWDQVTGCSAAYATLHLNLTEYGFYGWNQNVVVCANATIFPDSLNQTQIASRPPADVVLVLDASGSMYWQPNGHASSSDQNVNVTHLTGSIQGPSSWVNVGTVDFGEIPTQFSATVSRTGHSGSNSLQIRMVRGSTILFASSSTIYSDGTSSSSGLTNAQGNDFGSANMNKYGKSGNWSIQVQNTGSSSVSYAVDVQARKLDCVRNAATMFLRLLNPKLDRVAIVEFGERYGDTYYWAKNIGGFYNLTTQFSSAMNDINWRTPSTDQIGYGFERSGSTTWWGGTTPLGAGLEVGNRLFNGTNGARPGSQRVLILITDGKENVRPSPPVPCPPGGPGTQYSSGPDYSITSRLPEDAYKASNVTTYTIGFGKDADGSALTQLANLGHGKYYFAANGQQLNQILANITYTFNDKFVFHFSLNQEFGIGVNVLPNSSLTVFFIDATTHQRHKVIPTGFSYQGYGNFLVTVAYAGSKNPEAVDIMVQDPRGILVEILLNYKDWGGS